jgi:hypothetical protein
MQKDIQTKRTDIQKYSIETKRQTGRKQRYERTEKYRKTKKRTNLYTETSLSMGCLTMMALFLSLKLLGKACLKFSNL